MSCDFQCSDEKKTINKIKFCWAPLTWSSRLSPYLVINKGQTVLTLHRPQLLKGLIVLFRSCHPCSNILFCFSCCPMTVQLCGCTNELCCWLLVFTSPLSRRGGGNYLSSETMTKPLDPPLLEHQEDDFKFLDKMSSELDPCKGHDVCWEVPMGWHNWVNPWSIQHLGLAGVLGLRESTSGSLRTHHSLCAMTTFAKHENSTDGVTSWALPENTLSMDH